MTRTAVLVVTAGTVVVVLLAGCTSPAPPTPDTTTGASSAPAATTTTSAGAPTPSGTPGPVTGAPTTPSGDWSPGAPLVSVQLMPTGAGGWPRGLPAAAVDGTTADAAAVDGTTADAVAVAFAMTTFSYDTTGDVSEFDAQVRAAVYATPAYAAQLRTPLARTGSAAFTTLAAHHGFTTVTATKNNDDGAPPDRLRGAARSYSLTVTGQGEGGWSAPIDASTMYMVLTRTGGDAPWRIDNVTFRGGS